MSIVVGCSLAACGASPDDKTPAPNAAAVTSKANGSVGDWHTLAPMPEPRANHCSAVVGDYLVVIGGNYKPAGSSDFVKTAAVHAARIDGEGGLGPWLTAGQAPSPVTECTAASDDDQLIVIDGLYDDAANEQKVWTAKIGADGMLSTWTSIGALPEGQRMLSSEAAVREGDLYVMTTELPDAGDATLAYRATLGDALGSWSSYPWLPGFRAQASFAFGDAFVYALGGYESGAQGNEVVARVDAAPVGSDGAVGGAFPLAPLAAPAAFGEAALIDDYLFMVGGKPAIYDPGTATVTSAHVRGDGSVEAWTTQTPLPEARTNHDMVIAGDYAYVTGGATDGPGVDTVFSARVRF